MNINKIKLSRARIEILQSELVWRSHLQISYTIFIRAINFHHKL